MAEKYLAAVTLLFTCLVWGSNASHDEGNFVSASLFFSASLGRYFIYDYYYVPKHTYYVLLNLIIIL